MAGFLERIFGRRLPAGEQPGAADARQTGAATAGEAAAALDRLGLQTAQFQAGCAHSAGRQREHNEDALFTLTTNLVSAADNLPFGLYVVADGMGGHRQGEIASGIAVRAMASYVLQQLYLPLFRLPPVPPEASLQEIMRQGMQDAHRAILAQIPGGGSTMTAALVLGDQMTLGHVGDSRAYAIAPDGSLQALTRDHSLVKRLEELGQITRDEAAVHPQRNVLYRALGQGEPFDAEIATHPIPASGSLLICSDGLWGVVPEAEIARLARSAPTPALACQQLVEAANAAGGPDNVAAILVRFPP